MEKQVFRLDEQQYADDKLIPTYTRFWRRIEFGQAIRMRSSTYFQSALDSIDAALQLLVTGQTSQSYLLFFQSLEVSLKGVLDEIRSAGISGWMAKNPALARQVAANSSEEILTDIQGMHFREAFKGVAPIASFSSIYADRVPELNRIRNEIVHRGGNSQKDYYYIDLILCCIFPLLDELYQKVLQLDLADWIFHPIAREVIVAAKYRRMTPNDSKYHAQCVASLQSAYFSIYRIGEVGLPEFNSQGFGKFDSSADEYLDWKEECRRSIKDDIINYSCGSLDDDANELACHVCHEECFITSDWEEICFQGEKAYRITGIKCPNCRLEVTDPVFARIHYGAITSDLLGQKAWDDLSNQLGQ